ncbi:MAG: 3'-5' exonuclease [Candidatus Melainabacteria bacterium]|nr:3'-5' exonuclease [Candidatus Melainabacteria bacterium]
MNETTGVEVVSAIMAPQMPRHQDILARLNKEQAQAVSQGWGPSLIVAGAGSGKTTVLTRRVAFLIKELGQDADSIMAVTFTNKAAKEMKTRIETIIGDRTRFQWIGTFHSMCARLLRKYVEDYKTPEGWQWSKNFVIYDETDSMNVLKAEMKKLGFDDKVFPPKEIRATISALKNDGYTYNLYAAEAVAYRERKIAEIFAVYQKGLATNNAFDFDDLILVFTDLMRRNPAVRASLTRRFQHLMIDEFQDTNKSQYEFVRLLGDVFSSPEEISAGRGRSLAGLTEQEVKDQWHERSLMVVGDVDQSIYSWRKADYRIFLGFQNDFSNCNMIKLEENYRSTSTILDIANSVIRNNTERIDKELRCNRDAGAKATYYEGSDQIDEAFYVVEELKRLKARGRAYNDATILYRTNAQSRAIEEVLIRSGVPYTVVGGTKFYDRAEIKDIIAYLKLTFNPKDGQSFMRVVNQPRRGIGKTSMERLTAYADQRGCSVIEAAVEAQRIGNLSPKTMAALSQFANCVFTRWRPRSVPEQLNEETGQPMGYKDPISGLIQMILDDTGYMDMLAEEAMNSKDELAVGRMENIRELLLVAKEFEDVADTPDLETFLTRISLVSDLDNEKLEKEDNLKLMTLHSAKGLEFPVVFLMGLEEGILPHMRSLESDTAMEEERRLMYVGVTRAEDLLYITRARKRSFINRQADGSSGFSAQMLPASRFLSEITPGLLSGFFPGASGGAGGGNTRGGGYDDENQEHWGGGGSGFAKKPSREGYIDDDSSSSRSGGGYYDGGGSDKYGDNSGGGNRTGGGYGNSNGGRSGYGGGNQYGGGQRTGSGSGGYGGGQRTGSGAGGGAKPAASGAGGGASRQVYRNGQRVEGLTTGQRKEPPRTFANQHTPGQFKPSMYDNTGRPGAPAEPEFERMVVGDVVQHAKFGVGKVEQVIGEGNKELYAITFGEPGKKILDPKFAKLIKLSPEA